MSVRVLGLLACMIIASTNSFAFDLQGHRGARGLAPENTLPAFAKALSIGVSTLELDTGVTSDGVVVVTHNPNLEPDLTRDSSGNWLESKLLIRSLTLDQLKKFDVGKYRPGSRSASRFPKQTGMDNISVPALQQVFELANRAGNTAVRFNIETKINPTKPDDTVDAETFAKALIAEINKAGLANRVSIQSFDWRTLQISQSITPEIETVYLSAQQQWMDTIAGGDDWTAGFTASDHDNSVPNMIKAAGGKVWSPFYGDLSGDGKMIKQAHALGLTVIPWTINDPAIMNKLMDLNVDGIITDYPDMLRDVMQRRGLNLPAATPVEP